MASAGWEQAWTCQLYDWIRGDQTTIGTGSIRFGHRSIHEQMLEEAPRQTNLGNAGNRLIQGINLHRG